MNSKGITTDNFDGGKGLELIPFEKVEVIFNVPPYLAHNDPTVHDGFGDAAFLVKYRLLSANDKHSNYILTAFLGWNLPTGDPFVGPLFATVQDYVGQSGEQRLACFGYITAYFGTSPYVAGRDLRAIFSIYQHLHPFAKISTCRKTINSLSFFDN